MAEVAVIDLDFAEQTEKKNQSVKRKRDSQIPVETEAKIRDLNVELQSLFKYFKEVTSENEVDTFVESHLSSCSSSNVNAMVALLLEERSASYSKLSSEIFEKLKERGSAVTIASVKSNVIYIGRRVCYGVQITDADVLEDETESCLWCWETRDMKLIPTAIRGVLKVRRTCRKKISDRITAISALLSLLQNPMDCRSYENDVKKASDKLNKVLGEADIRLVAETSKKNDVSEMVQKGAKREEKLLIKQLEKAKREEEKEKKRMDCERQKEKLQNEKELRRLQEEADRDEKRREKEESEMRKQLKRKQEEVEKDQRRREKEEAELKKQRTIQKQASVMKRFLKMTKDNSPSCNDQPPSNATTTSDVSNISENKHLSATLLMDCALRQKDEVDMKEIRKSHLDSWRCLGHSTRHGKRQHWGTRQKPKTAIIKEIKLSDIKGPEQDDELRIGSLVDGSGEANLDDKANSTSVCSVVRQSRRRKQLLQFDKSHRPAFYGVWPKKSHVVGPRNPLKKDPELEYDIDSDEEWEEEEPGESISDCEKDEEENLEEGTLKADDEDESEDGFFVPDGYLSENEGVENDRSPCNNENDDAGMSPSSKPEAESEEFTIWFRQIKHLHNLTEHALRKNQPLIIANVMHDKAHLLSSDNLTGTPKVEQLCLQALAMRPFSDGLIVEVLSEDNLQNEDQETCTPNKKVVVGSLAATPDSDLPTIVSVIQSCPHGINKVIESLSLKFPKTPKTQLRNTVREISDFVDNRWQVKKDILVKLGLPITPEKTGLRTMNIAAFFLKRLHANPSGHHPDPSKTSPELSKKPINSTSDAQQQTGQRLF